MQNAIAFSNNDVITIAWSYAKEPTGCMGFALYRIDEKGKAKLLPSHAFFKGYPKTWPADTLHYPIQKFYWKDPYARPEAEATGNRHFRYRIVPLSGKPGKLVPMPGFPILTTNEVTIASDLGAGVNAYFNRGLISTQKVSRFFKGKPAKQSLLDNVKDEKNPLRAALSGDMVEALTGFLARAKNSGQIHAALYALGDDQLVRSLCSLRGRLHIVLSNAVKKEDDTTKPMYVNKKGKKVYHQKDVDSNEGARGDLKRSAADKSDRLLSSGHIGHNKFLVHVDGKGKPKAVLFGSTNWTSTGLCTQTNNTLIIEDDGLAKRYMDYWNQLKKDTKAAAKAKGSLQGPALRAWDANGKLFSGIAGAKEVRSWFSPNTPKARSSKHANEKTPPDMKDLITCIDGAKHSILFLAFYPGTPSVAGWTAQALRRDKDLFVRGCVTNRSASGEFYYDLKGITPPKKIPGEKTPPVQDSRVVAAEAFDGKVIPAGWLKEILNAGFAVVHDKIVVIDPFSEDCVVATGSHNLGHKASFDNDENFIIIKGNKPLAMAYATHVLDVYDHFSFRVWSKHNAKNKDYSLADKPEDWLGKYYDASHALVSPQLKFWLQGATH